MCDGLAQARIKQQGSGKLCDVTVLHSPRDSDDFSGAELRPVVVILHGVDGMVGESETEIRKLTTQVADDGYVVFVPHYFGANGRGPACPQKRCCSSGP